MWIEIFVIVLLLAIIVAPRAIEVDRYLTVDEGLWMFHSSQFYYALGQREFENTFQRFHPGVTMMWAGTFGFLAEFPEFRALGQGYSGSGIEVGEILEQYGKAPLDLVAAGRWFMILQNTALLLLAYWALRQLLPIGLSVVVISVVSLEPFYVSLTNLLQMDGLLASYMFVSTLALFVYLYAEQQPAAPRKKTIFFILSAVMASGSILTKTPGIFLFLFTGLMLLIRLVEHRDFFLKTILHQLVLPLLVWVGIAGLVIFILWPALWVDPVGMLDQIIKNSADRLSNGIGFRLFFNGETLNARDFGWTYYPLSFLWRSSPLVVIGLLVTVAAVLKRWGIFQERRLRRVVFGLALAAFFFMLEMGLGEMKMDRYIAPVHLFLTCAAVLGWVAAAQQVSTLEFKRPRWNAVKNRAILLTALLMIAFQVSQLAGTYPYYYAYYNPLLGGTKTAEEIFWLGWGEGLEQVADYLNDQPEADQLSVMSMHALGPLSYFFDGESILKPWPGNLTFSMIRDLDYMVVYVSDRQINLHPRLLEVLNDLQPEFVVNINGVDYAELYNMHQLSPEDWESLRAGLAQD